MDSKSHNSIFIGYCETCKGFWLYYLERQRVIHSWDVLFKEDTWGYDEIPTTSPMQIQIEFDFQSESDNGPQLEEPA